MISSLGWNLTRGFDWVFRDLTLAVNGTGRSAASREHQQGQRNGRNLRHFFAPLDRYLGIGINNVDAAKMSCTCRLKPRVTEPR